MIVPVLAPAFGQAVLEVASWRFIFIGLGVYCTIVLAWALIRLPETHLPEKRRPLSIRSEEHTSELQSLMRISYAVFCLKKKKNSLTHTPYYNIREQNNT